MRNISSPATAGSSLSTQDIPTPAPRRRGRPRKHFASEGRSAASARKAAYRARLREKNLPHRPVRVLSRALFVDGKKVREEHEVKMLPVVPTKHLPFCKGANACLCDHPLSKGAYLTDAPKGCGELVSGGYTGKKVSVISHKNGGKDTIELANGRFAPLKCGRHVVTSSPIDNDDEDDAEFTHETTNILPDREVPPVTTIRISAPQCWCGNRATIINQSRLLCGLHAPVMKAT